MFWSNLGFVSYQFSDLYHSSVLSGLLFALDISARIERERHNPLRIH